MWRVAPQWWWFVMLAGCRPQVSPSPPPPPSQVTAPAAVTVQLPRTPVPEGLPAPATAQPPWDEDELPRILAVQPLVHAAAARHGVDADVINAIIWHESRFNAQARGPGGAAGLMQLMPTTSKGLAKRLGRPNRPYDPAFNVEAGALLLSRLLTVFDGDLKLAIAGYGLGHVAVRRRIEAGEALPDRTLRFIANIETWAPAFATLPCPDGRERDGDGMCVAMARP